MSMIDDIKRDREAGTQGPWFVRTLENFGWNIVQYIGGDKHNISRVGKTNSETDARRIARVPDMEAALLAADELARALAEIELLTATGDGLDPDTTIRVHMLAGIGRATHDEAAWFRWPEGRGMP